VLCSFHDPLIPEHLQALTIPYWANRVVIRNRGRRAAEDCKGALKVILAAGDTHLEEELKLRWIPIVEEYKMTINAYSEEYLDVCAYLLNEGGIIEDITDYLEQVKKAAYESQSPRLVEKHSRE
jgi:hypothetical protein